MANEQLSRKTVIVDGKEIDKEIVHQCMDTVEQAVLDVVTHLVKNGAEKEDVINAAKATAEAIVVGMSFRLSFFLDSKENKAPKQSVLGCVNNQNTAIKLKPTPGYYQYGCRYNPDTSGAHHQNRLVFRRNDEI